MAMELDIRRQVSRNLDGAEKRHFGTKSPSNFSDFLVVGGDNNTVDKRRRQGVSNRMGNKRLAGQRINIFAGQGLGAAAGWYQRDIRANHC